MIGSKIVSIVMKEGKSWSDVAYSFFSDVELERKDLVIADTQHGFKIGKVAKVSGLTKNQRAKATSWVVQKIDVKAHEARIKRGELIQEIDNKMEEILDQHNKYAIYVELAKTNPEMSKLIEELKSVDPSSVPQIP